MNFFQKKYTPKSLNDITFSSRSIDLLKNLSFNHKKLPNLLFSGMKTFDLMLIVRAFINDIYGYDNIINKKINISYDGSDMNILSSQYHYEFDMNYYKFSRRDLILKFINAVSKTVNVSTGSFNIVVIKDAHLITHKVQAALRRTMEQYSKSIRFIFISRSQNNLVEAIQSRCQKILIVKPDLKWMIKFLNKISKYEKITVDKKVLAKIAFLSNFSYIDCLDILQLYQKNPNSLKLYKKFNPYNEILFYIKKGNINYFSKIENLLYNLLMIDIHISDIIKSILQKIISDKEIPDKLKIEATNISASCEYRCIYGNKNIIHLNYYISKLIQLFNNSN